MKKYYRIIEYKKVNEFAAAVVLFLAAIGAMNAQAQGQAELASEKDLLKDTVLFVSSHHPRIRSLALGLATKLSAADYARWTYPDPRLDLLQSHARMNDAMINPNPNYRLWFRDAQEYRIVQPIPFPGRLTVRARIADLDVDVERLRLGIEKNNLVEGFVGILIDTAQLRKIKEITRQTADRMKILSDVARTRYSAGEGSLADVSRARVRFEEYNQKIVDIDGQILSAKHDLEYFLYRAQLRGKEPLEESETDTMPMDDASHSLPEEMFRRLADVAVIQPYLNDLETSRRAAEKDLENVSLEIALAKKEETRRDKIRTLARMDYLPDFEIFGGYRRENFHTSDYFAQGRENMATAGVTIRIPLWSALANPYQVEEKSNDLRAARLQRNDLIHRHHTEYFSAQDRLESDTQRIELYTTRLIPQAVQARDSSYLSYQAGRVDFTTLLDSYDSLYLQETEEIKLRSDRDRRLLMIARLLNILIPELENHQVHESQD